MSYPLCRIKQNGMFCKKGMLYLRAPSFYYLKLPLSVAVTREQTYAYSLPRQPCLGMRYPSTPSCIGFTGALPTFILFLPRQQPDNPSPNRQWGLRGGERGRAARDNSKNGYSRCYLLTMITPTLHPCNPPSSFFVLLVAWRYFNHFQGLIIGPTVLIVGIGLLIAVSNNLWCWETNSQKIVLCLSWHTRVCSQKKQAYIDISFNIKHRSDSCYLPLYNG